MTTLTLFHLRYFGSMLIGSQFHRHVNVVYDAMVPTKGLVFQAKVFYFAMLALFTGKNINHLKKTN